MDLRGVAKYYSLPLAYTLRYATSCPQLSLSGVQPIFFNAGFWLVNFTREWFSSRFHWPSTSSVVRVNPKQREIPVM